MPGQPRVVGIVAGGGSLPREIAEHVKASGGAVHIVSILGEGDRDLSDFPSPRSAGRRSAAWCAPCATPASPKWSSSARCAGPILAPSSPTSDFFLNLPAIAARRRDERRRRRAERRRALLRKQGLQGRLADRGGAGAAGRRGPARRPQGRGARDGRHRARLRRGARARPVRRRPGGGRHRRAGSKPSRVPRAPTPCWRASPCSGGCPRAASVRAAACSSSGPSRARRCASTCRRSAPAP